jgi:hypothetical protein
LLVDCACFFFLKRSWNSLLFSLVYFLNTLLCQTFGEDDVLFVVTSNELLPVRFACTFDFGSYTRLWVQMCTKAWWWKSTEKEREVQNFLDDARLLLWQGLREFDRRTSKDWLFFDELPEQNSGEVEESDAIYSKHRINLHVAFNTGFGHSESIWAIDWSRI